jgi:endogenous inhibitor of DNA gyrase (YacG/DUF329 family)
VTDDTRERPRSLHCPTCSGPVAWAGNPARPFRSLSRTPIDLGRWLDETFRVRGPSLSLPDLPVATAAEDQAAERDTPVARD